MPEALLRQIFFIHTKCCQARIASSINVKTKNNKKKHAKIILQPLKSSHKALNGPYLAFAHHFYPFFWSALSLQNNIKKLKKRPLKFWDWDPSSSTRHIILFIFAPLSALVLISLTWTSFYFSFLSMKWRFSIYSVKT